MKNSTMSLVLQPLKTRKERCQELEKTLIEWSKKKIASERAIANYKSFDPEQSLQNISKLHYLKDQLSENFREVDAVILCDIAEITKLESALASPFNIFSWFSNEQTVLRARILMLKSGVTKRKKLSNEIQIQSGDAQSRIDVGLKEIEFFENFEFKKEQNGLIEAEASMSVILAELDKIKSEISGIELAAGSLIAEYETYQEKIRLLKHRIVVAESFESQLNLASNGYERAMIHENCQSEFGQGSPKRVKYDAQRELRSFEHNIPKLERRIENQLKKADMKINHIIIDGNNLCYRGSEFIRLHAITLLSDELRKRCKVTIVFDASICNLMRTDVDGIGRIIGRSAAVHIVPPRNSADEFILRLAGDATDCYILSNDRFAEFSDYSAVKQNRLLRFLVADNKVVINDLDVTVLLRA